MRNTLLVLCVVALLGCGTKTQKITITNRHDFRLKDKLVVLDRTAIKTAKGLPCIVAANDRHTPSQLVDHNQDGVWDQIIFQATVEAQSNVEFNIDWVSEDAYPTYVKQTQVYLGYSESKHGRFVSIDQHERDSSHVPQKAPYTYQFEGPGWESNLVAFRSYFDTRNGKDIFGKTAKELVLQKIGTGENYHTLQDWGMDVLKVGQSLGAGALAIIKNDSLIRLGQTKSAEFLKIEEGPIRSSFTLRYKGWNVWGQEYEVDETVSIQANKRWFKSTVSLRKEKSSVDTLVVGIVNLKGAMVDSFFQSGNHVLYTHGKQSENGDVLGMALIVRREHHVKVGKAPIEGDGITHSELAYLMPSKNSYSYYFYAGWELENTEFKELANFRRNLEATANEISADLTVEVQ